MNTDDMDGLKSYADDVLRSQLSPLRVSEIIKKSIDLVTANTTPRDIQSDLFRAIETEESLTVLVGRPYIGTTSMALYVAIEEAKRGKIVYYATPAHSAPQLVMRMLTCMASVNHVFLTTGMVKVEDWHRIAESAALLESLPIYILANGAVSPYHIAESTREKEVDLVIVDYLQALNGIDVINNLWNIAETRASVLLLAKTPDGVNEATQKDIAVLTANQRRPSASFSMIHRRPLATEDDIHTQRGNVRYIRGIDGCVLPIDAKYIHEPGIGIIGQLQPPESNE